MDKHEQEEDACYFQMKKFLVGVVKENRLYRLLCSLIHESVQVVQKNETLTIWHERLAI
jgi:hypothetical protein